MADKSTYTSAKMNQLKMGNNQDLLRNCYPTRPPVSKNLGFNKMGLERKPTNILEV
jgi:hypothetical protein